MNHSSLQFCKIIGRENRKRGLMYQVLWKGQSLQQITWEPLKNLISYIDDVKYYEQTQKKITQSIDHADQNQMNINQEAETKKQSLLGMSEGERKEGELEQQKEMKIFEGEQKKQNGSEFSELNNEFKHDQLDQKQKEGNKRETGEDFPNELKIEEPVIKLGQDPIKSTNPIQGDINRVKMLLERKMEPRTIDFDSLYHQETKLLEISRLNSELQFKGSDFPLRKLKSVQIHNFSSSSIKVMSCLCLFHQERTLSVKEIFKANQLWYALLTFGENIGIFNAQEVYTQKPRLIEKYLSDIIMD